MTEERPPRSSCLAQGLAGLFHLTAGGVLAVSSPVLLLLVAEGAASLDTHPQNLGAVLLCGGALLLCPLSLLVGLLATALGRPGLAVLLQLAVAVVLGCAGVLGGVLGAVFG